MTKGKMASAPLAAALLATCLAGCFTEVGNPNEEQSLQAEFSIDYSRNPVVLPKAATATDTILIQQFWLELSEAEYRTYDSALDAFVEKHIWKDTTGLSVDFTGSDSITSLPRQMVPATTPTSLQLDVHLPAKATLLPDTVDFEAFPNRAYIKGLCGTTRFIFALPAVHELHITYSQAALETFRDGKIYNCRFVFFATKWLAGQPMAKAKMYADEKGRPVAIFDADHNAAEYQALVAAFYKSFNTLNVEASQ